MQFEWDEPKSDATLASRGFDFAYAALLFDDPHRIEREDVRNDYGEPRWQTIGEIEGRVFLVVYTIRGSATRIISARRAHDNEEKEYRDGKQNGDG
jgi:uncharacterized DUF497 family protein